MCVCTCIYAEILFEWHMWYNTSGNEGEVLRIWAELFPEKFVKREMCLRWLMNEALEDRG